MAGVVEDGKAKAAGVCSIIIAILALADLISGFILMGNGYYDGSGVWSGFGLAVIAILGIIVWMKKNKTVMVFFLVVSILWLILCIVQVVVVLISWLGIAVALTLNGCVIVDDDCSCYGNLFKEEEPLCANFGPIVTLLLAIIIISGLAVPMTFATSIIGCMGTCCAPAQTQVVVVQQPGMVMQQTGPPPPGYDKQ